MLGLVVGFRAIFIKRTKHAPRFKGGGIQIIRTAFVIGESVGAPGPGARGGAEAGEIGRGPLIDDGGGATTLLAMLAMLFERGGRGAKGRIGPRSDVLTTAARRGARIDGGGGVTLERGGALMAPKNAGTEARGVLVQFAGGAPEFQ